MTVSVCFIPFGTLGRVHVRYHANDYERAFALTNSEASIMFHTVKMREIFFSYSSVLALISFESYLNLLIDTYLRTTIDIFILYLFLLMYPVYTYANKACRQLEGRRC